MVHFYRHSKKFRLQNLSKINNLSLVRGSIQKGITIDLNYKDYKTALARDQASICGTKL